MAEVGLGEFGGCFLAGSKFSEGNKDIVVDYMAVI